jgi:glucose-1-phosphate thymidylyltransferase
MLVESEATSPGYAYTGARLSAFEQVANRPIVHHVLDVLREVGLGGIVIAGEADALIDMREALGDYEPGLDHVEYAVCPVGSGMSGMFAAAAPLVGESPCVIQPADGLFDQPLSTLVDLLVSGSVDLMLLTGRHGEDDEAGAGLDVVAHSAVPVVRSFADVGVFGPGAFARTSEQLRGGTGADLTAAGRLLVADGGRVGVYPGEGWRRYRGDGHDLLDINRIALDRLDGSIPAPVRAGNRFEGRVRIDPTATVRSSAITGPAVIGPGASVVDSYLGPYTAIGADARIEGVEIERSIVSPGASVMHVGGRLVSSIVGRDARVYRDFSLPRALRLWVGGGDEIALC